LIESALRSELIIQPKTMNTAQRRENRIHRTTTGQQNPPHEDGKSKQRNI
jgi:hypothetical protein